MKFEREGYHITVDIEKGMQDGQVSFYAEFFSDMLNLIPKVSFQCTF